MLQRVIPALLSVAVLCCGCSGSGVGGAGRPGKAQPTVPPAVSASESLKVLDDYVTRHNRAAASGDVKAWQDTATGPLRDLISAQATMNHGSPPTGELTLVNPVMYVPRLTGYPRWFAAAALEEHPGGDRPVEVVLLFVRTSAGDDWRPGHRLPFKGRPPEIATDDQGYARPVALQAGGLATSPGALPTAHAAYLNGGGAAAFAPDPYSRSQRGSRPDGGGWSRTDRFTAGREPVYALRTQDGGALVWYSVEQTARLTSDGAVSRTALPTAVRGYLDGAKDVSGSTVEATWTWLTIGYIPTRGQAAVLGESVNLIRATAT